ncbi:nineteen complex-related protein 2-domain-containing protein [Phakopsora pachyrhizi]|uniref:Nineteen complex-related protein 2-domain-containing protein n=1 Tax=Phakopsora pachyrhizi TaxID=170000 RepID=A0AAV0AN60_PHAPC|nr:nineteen complex-related protein 2-domain-containing protein [Phakopsora pachyrhizi]
MIRLIRRIIHLEGSYKDLRASKHLIPNLYLPNLYLGQSPNLLAQLIQAHISTNFDHQTYPDGSEAVVANIPSSSIIKSAKERRSQARKAGLTNLSSGVNLSKDLTSPSGQDFISLSTASDLTRAITSKSGESRLVREEDEFGEGDDEHAEYTGAKERVPLGEKAGLRAEASRKAGMESMITEAGEDLYEGNEEELEWEAEQIRRGGIGNSVGEKTTTQPSKQIYRAAPVPERRNLNTLSSVTSRFSDSLGLLEDSVSEQEQNVIIFETAEKSLDQQESDLRLEVSREIEREVFFQDFKAFIDDINQFFSVKWLELEKVEKDLLSILRERSQLICKRRYEDLSDDLALFKSGDVGITRPSVVEEDLKQNGNEDEVRGKDESADEFDELGRSRRELDISSQAPSRRYRRKERIERRKRRRAGEGRVASAPEDEGYSTDDSLSPADSSDLLSASQSLISSTSDILRDTSNPIFLSPTNPSSIAEKFQAWKSNYPEDYSNAYGNLALVQAWEFWVRMEIVGGLNLWSIREWVEVKDRRGIENWRWMKGLEAYDHSCSIEDQEDRSDSVVPEMIKEVVIPVLTTLIRCSYDPLSVVATTKALELVEQIGCFIDLEEEDCDEKCERFVMSFLERFKISLQELKHLISDGDDDFKRSLLSQVGCEGIEARNRFLNRCLKLFKQGLRWRRFFNRKLTMMSYDDESKSFVEQEEEGRRVLSFKEVLSGELVEGIMVPVILIGWETGGKEISKKILECSPNGVLNERLIETLKEGYVKEEVQ